MPINHVDYTDHIKISIELNEVQVLKYSENANMYFPVKCLMTDRRIMFLSIMEIFLNMSGTRPSVVFIELSDLCK